MEGIRRTIATMAHIEAIMAHQNAVVFVKLVLVVALSMGAAGMVMFLGGR